MFCKKPRKKLRENGLSIRNDLQYILSHVSVLTNLKIMIIIMIKLRFQNSSYVVYKERYKELQIELTPHTNFH